MCYWIEAESFVIRGVVWPDSARLVHQLIERSQVRWAWRGLLAIKLDSQTTAAEMDGRGFLAGLNRGCRGRPTNWEAVGQILVDGYSA